MKAILILFLGLALISCGKKKKEATAPRVAATQHQEVNQLPKLFMTDNDRNITDASKLTGKNIIVLFFPDCDHCKREAAEIAERIKSFDGYTLYFLSINPFEEIIKFAETYKLSSVKNVKFVQTTGDAVYNNFGAVPTPSMYIYHEGKLMKKFNGETSLDEVVRYL